MLLLNRSELRRLVLSPSKREPLKKESPVAKRQLPTGYHADEDAWYGDASGPNRTRHKVRIDLKSGHIHIIERGKSASKAGPETKPIAKSLCGRQLLLGSDWGFPSVVLISKKVDSGSKSKAPGYGEVGASGERWITVHPHGDAHDGFPVKINQNRDGSWRIVGGAGGALNGLRLHGLKSPEQYKQTAKENLDKRREARAKAQAESEAQIHARHRDDLSREALESGKTTTPEAIHEEAAKRAREEIATTKKEREALGLEYDEEQRKAEKELIAHVANEHGWDTSDLELSESDIAAARDEAHKALLAADPDLLNKPEKHNAKTEQAVQAVISAHHSALLSRANEAIRNHQNLIVAAHDQAVEGELGVLKVGDLVKTVLGDSGKGYASNLADEALERGIDSEAIREMADNAKWENLLDRKGGDKTEAHKAKDAVERMHEARATTQAGIDKAKEKLGAAGGALDKVRDLDTTPKSSVGASASLLSKAKGLQDRIAGLKGAKRALKGGDDLETLPKAAVVVAKDITPEEAAKRVLNDLEEKNRTTAVSALHDLYNVQEGHKSLRQHLLSGHNAFFGNVGNIVNVRAPDPLTADILGPSAAAHVFRRALEASLKSESGEVDRKQLDALKRALAEHHIEKQVDACNAATEFANGKFSEAEKLAVGDAELEHLHGVLDGLERNQKRIELLREGREAVGVAMGRMEAAAALNEAFLSDRTHKNDGGSDDVQVALGAISIQDAIRQASAIGLKQGEYEIAHDGKNAILQIKSAGLDTLAAGLQESPEHLERARVVSEIQSGKHDDPKFIPALFSRRPSVDLSREDGELNLNGQAVTLSLEGATDASDVRSLLESHIAQRIEAGQDPLAVASEVKSAAFRASYGEGHESQFDAALSQLLPSPVAIQGADDAKAFIEAQREKLSEIHANWLQSQVASGAMDAETASVHRQTLPATWQSRDLVYQIALQDPRLQHAFSDVGELGRVGRRSIRDYAYQHIFGLDPKNREEPISPLSPSERKAWDGWRKLEKENPDPYAAIQAHWRDSETADGGSDGGLLGGGMFDDFAPTPHPFASIDLGDDNAVLEAARGRAAELGYQKERRVTDLRAGKYEDVVPELEPSVENPPEKAAREARRRIQGALRAHAFEHLFGAPDLASSDGESDSATNPASNFNPSNVATAGERWGQYVRDMGGEVRAYRTVQEKMKGDVAGRYAKGHRQIHGAEFHTVPVALTHSDAHALASLSPDKRAELASQKAREAAAVRKREGGGFAAEGEGAVASKLDAKRQSELFGPSLFGSEAAKTDSQKQDTHRLSLGAAAENQLAGLMPKLNLRRGTSAAGDLDFSKGSGLKQQRAIKQAVAAKRMQLSLGVGVGKTASALGVYGEHRQSGDVKRALMVVPSIVQEQFGSEAARFFDPTHKEFPSWHSDAGATREERHAAYSESGGHDIVVVTHQSLRDDLTHALAQHRFGGDEGQAREWLLSAPRHERSAAMDAATKSLGWNFDMTVADEAHSLLGRDGKEDSVMANAIDALTDSKQYHVGMSADPVKNDASESFSVSQKVAPWRYINDNDPRKGNRGTMTKSEFARRYSVNTDAAHEALQREMAPYQYAESAPPDVEKINRNFHDLKMTPPQQKEYDGVTSAYNRARSARLRGSVDVEAVKSLSPNSFAEIPASQHEQKARELSSSLGMIRDAAYNRVVNQHPQGAKLEHLKKRLKEMPPDKHPKIVFAKHLGTVDLLHDELKKAGYRVGKLDGRMNGKEKEAAKLGLSPQWDAKANGGKGAYASPPQFDILVCSDAGAVGGNMQRASHVITYDREVTAMTHHQRNGRAYRTGQRNAVTLESLGTDSDYERRQGQIFNRKNKLRENLTTPTETIDDTGLAQKIHELRQQAIEGVATSPVEESKPKRKAKVSKSKLKEISKSLRSQRFVAGEDCPHCGASMERADGDKEGMSSCDACGKAWPSSVWASASLSGDGGQGWHCPWCQEVNVSDSPETGRECYKCKGCVDVIEKAGQKNWRVHPAPSERDRLQEISKAHATGYPLQGRRKFRGLDISIEQRKGGIRSGVDADGKAWRVSMTYPYGYIRRSEGADHDHVDCFIGPDEKAPEVYIIDTNNPETGKFDEQKCMLGFPSAKAAKAAFMENYTSPNFFRSMRAMPYEEFETKVLETLSAGGGPVHGIVKSVDTTEIVPQPSTPTALAVALGSLHALLPSLGVVVVDSGYTFVCRNPSSVAPSVVLSATKLGLEVWMESPKKSLSGERRLKIIEASSGRNRILTIRDASSSAETPLL